MLKVHLNTESHADAKNRPFYKRSKEYNNKTSTKKEAGIKNRTPPSGMLCHCCFFPPLCVADAGKNQGENVKSRTRKIPQSNSLGHWAHLQESSKSVWRLKETGKQAVIQLTNEVSLAQIWVIFVGFTEINLAHVVWMWGWVVKRIFGNPLDAAAVASQQS